jgi:NHL repeat
VQSCDAFLPHFPSSKDNLIVPTFDRTRVTRVMNTLRLRLQRAFEISCRKCCKSFFQAVIESRAVRRGIIRLVFCVALWTGDKAWAQTDYSPPYTFTTVAGSPGLSGCRDGTNSSARFGVGIMSLALDSLGRVYAGHGGVLRLASENISAGQTNWIVTTVAGGNCLGGGVVDGTNNGAQFRGISGLAIDSADQIYVSDFSVREVTASISGGATNWVVTTLAGSPVAQGSADGVGAQARFRNPRGIAVDSAGRLYLTDVGNNTIRMLAPSVTDGQTNWVVSTIAGLAGIPGSTDGTGDAARFNAPLGIAVDRAGNLYVTDALNFTIRQVAPSVSLDQTNWVVTTIAGTVGTQGSDDGPGSAALFFEPSGIAIDRSGNLFVVDSGPLGQANSGNCTIRKLTLNLSGGQTNWMVSTLAGLPGNTGSADGTGDQARFLSPLAVAVGAAESLVVADTGNFTVRMGWPAVPLMVLSTPVIGSQVMLDFSLNYDWSLTFELLQASQPQGPWLSSPGAILSTNTPGVSYRFTAPVSASAQFYRVHAF